METLGQPEDIASSEKTLRELALKSFINFWGKKDESSYSYEEQNLLAKKSAESEEAARRFLESKNDKKHINAIFAPLGTALFYLESEESEFIPEVRRKELIDKIKDLYADLDIAREQENISDELISKTLDVMDEIKIYLQ